MAFSVLDLNGNFKNAIPGLSVATGKLLTVSNSLTLTAVDGSTLAIGGGGTLGTAAYTASTAYSPVAGSSSLVTVGTLTNDLLFTDATYDIGKSGSTRPRDGFFSRNFTIGGLLTVNGFGTHALSASGTGGQILSIRNPTAGSFNIADLQLGNDSSAARFELFITSTTYTASEGADTACAYSQGAGGFKFFAINAIGTIGFYAGGITLSAKINANGTQTWAPYGAGAATFDASGNITSVSDVRFKDRISPLPYGLYEVLQLHPVQHGYNALSGLERDHLYGGFLAQDVQAVLPLAVGREARGYLTLADRPILGACVNAIQTLDARITLLEVSQDHG
jgi:hypothetical protein